jgi:hypothetical protein
MSIFTDFADVHWAASAAAGMLTDCTPRGKTAVKVKFEEPDLLDLNGSQSKQFLIEYRKADMPTLAEGDSLSIVERDGVIAKYSVREAPYVDPQRGQDGTYRCAVLTRDRARDS